MKRIFQLAAFLLLIYPLDSALFGQESIDSLESALLTAEDELEKLQVYRGLIRGLVQQNPVKAVQYAEDALELAQELPDTVLLPDLYNAIGMAHYYKGNLLISIEYFLKARSEYELQGIYSTIPFLIKVFEHPRFAAGELTTNFISEQPDLFDARRDLLKIAALSAVIFQQQEKGKVRYQRDTDQSGSAWKKEHRKNSME